MWRKRAIDLLEQCSAEISNLHVACRSRVQIEEKIGNVKIEESAKVSKRGKILWLRCPNVLSYKPGTAVYLEAHHRQRR